MEETSNLEKIQEYIKDFFSRTSIDLSVEFLPAKKIDKNSSDTEENNNSEQEKAIILPVNIEAVDAQILIGEKGQTLADIQYLLKLILRKKFNQFILVDLDINDYKKKKVEFLKEMAESVADDVVLLKKEKFLPPMPPYERRIIYLELAERNDVIAESIGNERDKKIVIRPV